jgi:hypothetical protein
MIGAGRAVGLMPARQRQRRVVVLTRRYGAEVTRPAAGCAYAAALLREGAEVTVTTRFVRQSGSKPAERTGAVCTCAAIDSVTVRLAFRATRFSSGGSTAGAAPLPDGQRMPSMAGRRRAIGLLCGLLTFPFIVALRPTVIVVEQGPAWLALPVCLLSRLRVPFVLQVSDIKSLAMERGRYGAASGLQIRRNRRLENLLYRRASAIVTVTEASRANVAERLGSAGSEVHLIPNGAEVGIIRQADAAEKPTSGSSVSVTSSVIYAGTFGAAHDVGTILRQPAAPTNSRGRLSPVGEGPSERGSWRPRRVGDSTTSRSIPAFHCRC